MDKTNMIEVLKTLAKVSKERCESTIRDVVSVGLNEDTGIWACSETINTTYTTCQYLLPSDSSEDDTLNKFDNYLNKLEQQADDLIIRFKKYGSAPSESDKKGITQIYEDYLKLLD